MSYGVSIYKKRNGVLLAYIANRIPNVHLRKLLKIIYLMDEHFMKMRGVPLTWFDYQAWSKGPVAPEVYEIKNGAFNEFVKSYKATDNKRIVESILDKDIIQSQLKDDFSAFEISEINKMIDDFGHQSADELSDITHRPNSVWSKVVSENQLSFNEEIRKSDVAVSLDRLLDSNDWRSKAYENACFEMKLQAQLDSINPNYRIQLKVVTQSEREKYIIPSYSPVIP